jgi:hypothetical protein
MKIAHIKDMYKNGNPGYRPRYKPGIGIKDLGESSFKFMIMVAIAWFIMTMLC